MENLKKWLGILTSLIIIGACSSDDDIELQFENSLVSVTELFYVGHSLLTSDKYNFHQGTLTDIEHIDGSYEIITYSNGLMTQIDEFNSKNILEMTRTYVYDSYGRLITKTSNPFTQIKWDPLQETLWETMVLDFSYEEHVIMRTRSFYDQNDSFLRSYELTLHIGSNNLIDGIGSNAIVVYSNGNPIRYFINGYGEESDGVTT